MNAPPLVAVLGMHRSGTSALSGALARLGLHAGDEAELLPAAADNPLGFFERADVVAVNERLLRARAAFALADWLRAEDCEDPSLTADGGWLLGAWAPCNGLSVDAQHAAGIETSLCALRAGAGHAGGLLLKDPRLSLTLPAWRAQVADPVVLIGVRSPAAVADSLARRDRMPGELAAFLWARYTRAAIEVSEGLPRLLVDYDMLLADPQSMLDTLLAFLLANGIEVAAERREAALAFLSPQLRHAAGVMPASGDNEALYRQLLAAAPRVNAVPASAGLATDHPLERYQALRMMLSRRLSDARSRADGLAGALTRIERHVVSGTVVRALRRLKRDPGFGAP